MLRAIFFAIVRRAYKSKWYFIFMHLTIFYWKLIHKTVYCLIVYWWYLKKYILQVQSLKYHHRVATLLSHCHRVVTASLLDVNTLQLCATALPWSLCWSRQCCQHVAICFYHVATEGSSHTQNCLDLLQCRGNVVAMRWQSHAVTTLPEHVASTIAASVNGA